MSESNELQHIIFTKALPNGDVYFYEKQLRLDPLTGLPRDSQLKLLAVQKYGSEDVISLCSLYGVSQGCKLKVITAPNHQILALVPYAFATMQDHSVYAQTKINAQNDAASYQHAVNTLTNAIPYKSSDFYFNALRTSHSRLNDSPENNTPQLASQLWRTYIKGRAFDFIPHEITINDGNQDDSQTIYGDDSSSLPKFLNVTASISNSILTSHEKKNLLPKSRSLDRAWLPKYRLRAFAQEQVQILKQLLTKAQRSAQFAQLISKTTFYPNDIYASPQRNVNPLYAGLRVLTSNQTKSHNSLTKNKLDLAHLHEYFDYSRATYEHQDGIESPRQQAFTLQLIKENEEKDETKRLETAANVHALELIDTSAANNLPLSLLDNAEQQSAQAFAIAAYEGGHMLDYTSVSAQNHHALYNREPQHFSSWRWQYANQTGINYNQNLHSASNTLGLHYTKKPQSRTLGVFTDIGIPQDNYSSSFIAAQRYLSAPQKVQVIPRSVRDLQRLPALGSLAFAKQHEQNYWTWIDPRVTKLPSVSNMTSMMGTADTTVIDPNKAHAIVLNSDSFTPIENENIALAHSDVDLGNAPKLASIGIGLDTHTLDPLESIAPTKLVAESVNEAYSENTFITSAVNGIYQQQTYHHALPNTAEDERHTITTHYVSVDEDLNTQGLEGEMVDNEHEKLATAYHTPPEYSYEYQTDLGNAGNKTNTDQTIKASSDENTAPQLYEQNRSPLSPDHANEHNAADALRAAGTDNTIVSTTMTPSMTTTIAPDDSQAVKSSMKLTSQADGENLHENHESSRAQSVINSDGSRAQAQAQAQSPSTVSRPAQRYKSTTNTPAPVSAQTRAQAQAYIASLQANANQAVLAVKAAQKIAQATFGDTYEIPPFQMPNTTNNSRLGHLNLPNVNTPLYEDPYYIPTDSAIAFADQHAPYHQAFSHSTSISRYSYGAEFALQEEKEVRSAKEYQQHLQQLTQNQEQSAHTQDSSSRYSTNYHNSTSSLTTEDNDNFDFNDRFSSFITKQNNDFDPAISQRINAANEPRLRRGPDPMPLQHMQAQPMTQTISQQVTANTNKSITHNSSNARPYTPVATPWWRDQRMTEQNAQNAFAEEKFHQSRQGSFIGTPAEFLPEEKAEPVVNTDATTYINRSDLAPRTVLDDTSDRTIVSASSTSPLAHLFTNTIVSEPKRELTSPTRVISSVPQYADTTSADINDGNSTLVQNFNVLNSIENNETILAPESYLLSEPNNNLTNTTNTINTETNKDFVPSAYTAVERRPLKPHQIDRTFADFVTANGRKGTDEAIAVAAAAAARKGEYDPPLNDISAPAPTAVAWHTSKTTAISSTSADLAATYASANYNESSKAKPVLQSSPTAIAITPAPFTNGKKSANSIKRSLTISGTNAEGEEASIHDFSDFKTADGSTVSGDYKFHVISQKQLQEQRKNAAAQAKLAEEQAAQKKREQIESQINQLLKNLQKAAGIEMMVAHNTAEQAHEIAALKAKQAKEAAEREAEAKAKAEQDAKKATARETVEREAAAKAAAENEAKAKTQTEQDTKETATNETAKHESTQNKLNAQQADQQPQIKSATKDTAVITTNFSSENKSIELKAEADSQTATITPVAESKLDANKDHDENDNKLGLSPEEEARRNRAKLKKLKKQKRAAKRKAIQNEGSSKESHVLSATATTPSHESQISWRTNITSSALTQQPHLDKVTANEATNANKGSTETYDQAKANAINNDTKLSVENITANPYSKKNTSNVPTSENSAATDSKELKNKSEKQQTTPQQDAVTITKAEPSHPQTQAQAEQAKSTDSAPKNLHAKSEPKSENTAALQASNLTLNSRPESKSTSTDSVTSITVSISTDSDEKASINKSSDTTTNIIEKTSDSAAKTKAETNKSATTSVKAGNSLGENMADASYTSSSNKSMGTHNRSTLNLERDTSIAVIATPSYRQSKTFEQTMEPLKTIALAAQKPTADTIPAQPFTGLFPPSNSHLSTSATITASSAATNKTTRNLPTSVNKIFKKTPANVLNAETSLEAGLNLALAASAEDSDYAQEPKHISSATNATTTFTSTTTADSSNKPTLTLSSASASPKHIATLSNSMDNAWQQGSNSYKTTPDSQDKHNNDNYFLNTQFGANASKSINNDTGTVLTSHNTHSLASTEAKSLTAPAPLAIPTNGMATGAKEQSNHSPNNTLAQRQAAEQVLVIKAEYTHQSIDELNSTINSNNINKPLMFNAVNIISPNYHSQTNTTKQLLSKGQQIADHQIQELQTKPKTNEQNNKTASTANTNSTAASGSQTQSDTKVIATAYASESVNNTKANSNATLSSENTNTTSMVDSISTTRTEATSDTIVTQRTDVSKYSDENKANKDLTSISASGNTKIITAPTSETTLNTSTTISANINDSSLTTASSTEQKDKATNTHQQIIANNATDQVTANDSNPTQATNKASNAQKNQIMFATPKRFVEQSQNQLFTKPTASVSDTVKAMQKAVADVVATAHNDLDNEADELLSGTDFGTDEDPTLSYLQAANNSNTQNSQNNKGHNSLASLAAELIDDFDDPFDDSFTEELQKAQEEQNTDTTPHIHKNSANKSRT